MRPRAFTLLELLVSVGVIATLVALIMPTLAETRLAARRAGSLSNLRSHSTVFASYHNDWDGMFPYITDPTATETIIRPPGREPVRLEYFDAHRFWSVVLADMYYEGQYLHDTFESPASRWRAATSHYFYPCAMICRPEYWNTASRVDGRSQWRPTRIHECDHPAYKALLVEDVRLELAALDRLPPPTTPVRMAFVDGSAGSVELSEVKEGYHLGDGRHDQGGHLHDYPPALHTIDGIRGRDR